MDNKNFQYGSDTLGIRSVLGLAEQGWKGVFSAEAVRKIRQSQQYVSNIVNSRTTVYGVNTGFGILANTKISEEDTVILQHKILQSHSVGVGAAVSPEIAKIMGCSVRRVENHPAFYDSLHWRRQMEAIRRRRR